MKNNDSEIKKISKKVDKKILEEKHRARAWHLVKKILLWGVGLFSIIYLLGMIFGYTEGSNRCRYDEKLDEVFCWDPR